MILDKSGKVISSIYPDNNIIKNAACSPDGQIVIGLAESIRDAGYTEIRYIDTDTYNWGKTVSVPADIKRGKQMFFMGKGYDLYYSNDEYVYGLNEGNEPEKLLEWSAASGINVNITAMSAASPDKFICLKSSPGGFEAVTLTLEATKYYGKEENIIIATIKSDPYTSMDIANFNEKFHGKIKISVRDYSQYVTDNFNTDRAYNILYNDIIAGETIDIIEMWNYSDEYKTLVRKGVFCDHYSFLDTSQTLNRESLIEAVKKPFEYNGTLPLIVTSLSLETLIGKTKNLPGMEDGMTARELIDLSDSLNDGQRLFLNMDGDGLLSLTGRAGYTDFINYETSVCDFSGETFIEFLKLALKINNLPKIEKDTPLFYNDKVIFSGDSSSIEFGSFFKYMQIRNQFGFDEELTVTGYPSSESNGTIVAFSYAVAVMQASKHKDSSWLFIEHLLSDESYAYQMNKDFIFDTSISVTESWMKKLEEDVVGGYIHFAPDGIEYNSAENVKEYGIDEYILTSPYPPHIITQEDFDNFYRIVNSVSTPALFDEGIVSIVREEVLPMFAGTKTPEETAKIIQNRASIYMSERN